MDVRIGKRSSPPIYLVVDVQVTFTERSSRAFRSYLGRQGTCIERLCPVPQLAPFQMGLALHPTSGSTGGRPLWWLLQTNTEIMIRFGHFWCGKHFLFLTKNEQVYWQVSIEVDL